LTVTVKCHLVHINVDSNDLESLKSTEKEKICLVPPVVYLSRSAFFFPVIENTTCLAISVDKWASTSCSEKNRLVDGELKLAV
jgi:hypothetical protein